MTSQTPSGDRYSTVLPGDRVVARVRGAILFVDAPAVGGPADVAELRAALDVDGDPAPALRGRTGTAFAVIELRDGTARALLRGVAAADEERSITVAIFPSATAAAPDHVLHAGPDFAERVAPVAPGSVVTVTVGPPPPPAPACGPAALRLESGAVPGAGVVLWSDASLAPAGEGEIATDVFPADAPTNEEPTGVSPLFAATEYDVEVGDVNAAVVAGPMVEGRRCAFGHLNAPVAAYCTRCGALVDRRLPLESGPRPPLGLLVADDGTAFVVENDMVIGRDPAAFVAQRAGRAQSGAGRLVPIVLPDRTGALSRAHLEIRIDGWQVLAVDVGSANGTWVRPPGAAQPLRLPPGQPVPLGVGSDIHLGGRILQLQDGVGA
ncbi:MULTISPECIES: FHA domain-containing protein [Tsukamurella]|uniref:FHA domain-containing protein n=2 Tax=Tsukamurella TaxID=2060 RepID=A0A5C5S7A9_9ACTN|nr:MULTISPECIES: FHA domain-containing protein [Tsukamurella]NMD55293.1 FHA domain-containing protein [Tsukamurella columbiensis]TWS30740.1 FHA domain-containing protein [Tsukamurella conjunctivitidis]